MRFKTGYEFLKALIDNNGVLYSKSIEVRINKNTKDLEIAYISIDDDWFTTPPLKDKDLVECWDKEWSSRRDYLFWDEKYNRPFTEFGQRNGSKYDNYRKIETLPDWAIEARKTLEE